MTAPAGEQQQDTSGQGAGAAAGNSGAGGGSSDEKTFTQTQLNAVVASARREVESKFDGFDDIKSKAEQFDALTETAKTDIQRFQDQLASTSTERDTLKQDNSSLQTQLLRQKISATAGLDADLWDRVTGSTEEEIAADVDKLVSKFQPTRRAPLGPRSGSGASAPDARTPKDRAADALRGLRAGI